MQTKGIEVVTGSHVHVTGSIEESPISLARRRWHVSVILAQSNCGPVLVHLMPSRPAQASFTVTRFQVAECSVSSHMSAGRHPSGGSQSVGCVPVLPLICCPLQFGRIVLRRQAVGTFSMKPSGAELRITQSLSVQPMAHPLIVLRP